MIVRKVPTAIIDLPEIPLNEPTTGIGKLLRDIYATGEWQQYCAGVKKMVTQLYHILKRDAWEVAIPELVFEAV